MLTYAHSSAAIALSILSLSGVATGGCAVVYDFNEYTPSTETGAGGPWAKRFGGPNNDITGHPGLDVSPSGDVFITGTFERSIVVGKKPMLSDFFGVFLAKLSASTGDPLWSKTIADQLYPSPCALAVTPDDGIAVAGTFDNAFRNSDIDLSTPFGKDDIFLATYDTNGNLRGRELIGNMEDQRVLAVAVDPDNVIYITGQFQGTITLGPAPACTITSQAGSQDGFIAAFDYKRLCLWAKTFRATMTQVNVKGVALAADGNGVFVGGAYSGPFQFGTLMLPAGIQDQAFVARLDTNGNVLFLKDITNAQDVSLAFNPQTGGVYYGASLMLGAGDVIVGELDSAGQAVWPQQTYGGPLIDHLGAITRTPSGELLLTGWSTGSVDFGAPTLNRGMKDMFFARLSATGAPIGGKMFGDGQDQAGEDVRADGSGNVYISGGFNGNIDMGTGNLMSVGIADVVVAKLEAGSLP